MSALAQAQPAQQTQQGQPEGAVPRAGAWQVMAGAPGQPMVGYRLCFTKGGTDDLALLLPQVKGSASCSASTTRREGSELVWEMQCPQQGLNARARYTVQAESIAGTLAITSGSPPTVTEQAIRAQYAGACTP